MVKQIFDDSLGNLINADRVLFRDGLHEQTIVARLAFHMQLRIGGTEFNQYYVDVEYNRASGGVQKVLGGGASRVFVDLAFHGRGERGERENIVCAEVKKRKLSGEWTDAQHAANLIFPNAGDNFQKERQDILTDQNKLIDFTTAGDAHNLQGHVRAYELGVLIVPRYHAFKRNGVSVAQIPQIFVRYYINGAVAPNEDVLINVQI